MSSIESEIQLELKKSKENYKLRPLILLITEEDGSPFEWFIRNQDKLYGLGYKTINIEQCPDKNINSVLMNESVLQTLHDAFMGGTYKNEDHLSNAYVFCKMKHYQHNMALLSLLKKFKKDEKFKRWRYNFIDVESALIDRALQTKGIDSIRAERDQNFASKISESCDKADGGVVTILGSSHCTVYHILKNTNPICAKFSLFIDMSKLVLLEYNKASANFNVDEINKARKASYDRKRKAVMMECESYYAKGSSLFIDFTDDKRIAILDQVILKKALDLPRKLEQTTNAANLSSAASATDPTAASVKTETAGGTKSNDASEGSTLSLSGNHNSSVSDIKSNSEILAFSSIMKSLSQKEGTDQVETETATLVAGAKKKKKKKKK